MCYTATLPSLVKSENLNSELLNLTRIFNRWLKMLNSYGKLDETGLDSDFTAIAKVIKSVSVKRDIKRVVQRCRDYALAAVVNIKDLTRSLSIALKIMCKEQEDRETRIIKKYYADQGMTERYRPLSKRLKRERIRKIDRELMYTNTHTDNAETTKLVRRIVEKRAAQTVHRSSRRDRRTNQFRQSVRRATSFSLYSTTFTDYDQQKRAHGTHWKVIRYNCKGKKVLKAKFSYNSYDEAMEACERYVMHHPDDARPMTPYRCEHCGKWHIGHERVPQDTVETASEKFQENDGKISA